MYLLLKWSIHSRKAFVNLCGGFLLFAALAKAATLVAFRPALLEQLDPLLGMRNWVLLLIVALLELLSAAILFSRVELRLKLGVIFVLGVQFIAYRLLSGDIRYCSCLGTLFKGIPVVEGREWIITLITAYIMLLGSFALLMAGFLKDRAIVPSGSHKPQDEIHA